MKLKAAFKVVTRHGDEIILHGTMTKGTINWARRHNYEIIRIKLLTRP